LSYFEKKRVFLNPDYNNQFSAVEHDCIKFQQTWWSTLLFWGKPTSTICL